MFTVDKDLYFQEFGKFQSNRHTDTHNIERNTFLLCIYIVIVQYSLTDFLNTPRTRLNKVIAQITEETNRFKWVWVPVYPK